MYERGEDYYECADEGVVYSRAAVNSVKCPRAALVGPIEVRGIVVSDELVVVGRGSIKFIACISGLIVSYGGPILIDSVFCRKLYLIGSKYPVVVKRCRASELHLVNSVVKELESNRVTVGRKSSITKLASCSEIVFRDPHCWIEELACSPSKVSLEY